jgi:hypothetical protein
MASIRCPKCKAETKVDAGDLVELICFECGAKLKRRAAEPPPAANVKPKVKQARVATVAEDDGERGSKPTKRKARKNTVRLSKAHLFVAGIAVAVMGGVLIYSLGGKVGGGSRDGGASVAEVSAPVDADRHFPRLSVVKAAPGAIETEESKQDAIEREQAKVMREFDGETVEPLALDAPEWNVPPDGAPAPPAVLNAAFPNTPAYAMVQSSGNGQYFIAVPRTHIHRFIPQNKTPGSKEPRRYELREPAEKSVPVIDLKTLQPIGSYPNVAPYWCGGILAPDGRHLVGPDNDVHQLRTLEEGKLYVWAIDKPEPQRTIEMRGVVLWAGFASPREFAAVTFDEERKPDANNRPEVVKRSWTFWLYDIVEGKQIHKADLVDGDVADRYVWESSKKPNQESYEFNAGEMTQDSRGTDKPNVLYFVPEPLFGAIGPGGKRLYVGGKKGVTVIGVPEGRVLARLPIATTATMARDDYLGFGFSKDGTELRVVCHASKPQTGASFNRSFRYILCWDLRTGKGVHAAELKDQDLAGPPMDGPDPDSFVLGLRRTRHVSGVQHRKLQGSTDAFESVRGGGIVARRNGALLQSLDKPTFGRFDSAVHLQQFAETPYSGGFPIQKPKDAGPSVRFVKLAAQPVVVSPWDQFVTANPRPALTVADRKSIVKVVPGAAVAWAVPATKEKAISAVEATGELGAWPTVWSEAATGTIRAVGKPMVGAVHHVEWVKHDLKTGQAGNPITLWPWVSKKENAPSRFRPMLAAATRSGDRLALRDPDDGTRVDIFDADGKRLVGFQPHNEKVDWLAWCGPDRLLTKSKGIVTGWEIPACKAIFELTECPSEPLLAPSGAWLARTTDTRVDFVEVATGKSIGSITTTTTGTWRSTTLSPDGQRLVRVTDGDDKVLGVKEQGLGSRIHSWDLATGQERPAVSVPITIDGRAAWCSPRRLVVPNGISINRGNGWEKITCEIVDVDLGIVVASFGPPKGHSEPGDLKVPALRIDPLGRWWAARAGGSEAAYRPAKFDFLQAPDIGPAGYPFRPGVPVRAKVELDGHARPAAERVAAALQRLGFEVAPSGWLLQATARDVDTNVTLTFSANDPKGEAVPKIVMDWKLIDPNGKEAWTGRTEYPWVSGSSRYFTGRDHSRGGMANQTMITVTHFDFKGKVVRDAILEEIASQIGQSITPPTDFPLGQFDAGGIYRTLPVRSEYSVVDIRK